MQWNLNFKSFLKRGVTFVLLIFLVLIAQLPVQVIAKHHYMGLNAILWGILYFGLFLLFIFLALFSYRHVFHQTSHNLTLKNCGLVGLAYLTFLLVQIVLEMLNGALFHQAGTENNAMIIKLMQSDPYVLGFMTFSAVFFSPVLEELIFRGYFMHAFFKPDAFWLPIVLSGLLFSCGHLSNNVISFMIYAILGMILAFVYKKTGKIEVSIGVHFLNNLVAAVIILITIL